MKNNNPLPSAPSLRLLPPVTPTFAGIVWLAAALFLLATAINYGNNLIFALAFWLAALWLMSAWRCWRNLAGLVWHPDPQPTAFAGERLVIGGVLRDPTGRAHVGVALSQSLRHHKTQGEAAQVDGNNDSRLELALPAPARGRREIARLFLVSDHPFGLWRARRALPPVAALIFPQPAGALPLPDAAPRPAHWRQESGDFQGLRPYVAGDSPRRVNWRVYARQDALTINCFDGGRGGRALWLTPDACPGDMETRLSQLCRWVLEADRQGLEYGLRLGESRVSSPRPSPGRGQAWRIRCLTTLALQGAEDRDPASDIR
ncbi:MAG: DUF58 domain-containing protein [Zoogloeaceae bacterium]|jgi:uncharacterized protein (DUF58 family)|nr:DUF58 domain-containing protein [Zoogloeaceae bacterium]